jgi:hypothetical protein
MAFNRTNRWRGSLWRRKARTRLLQGGVHFPALALAALLSLAADTTGRPQAIPLIEYKVKAAFLLNFAKFVEWPSDAFQNDSAPIILCVFRHDPFGGVLDDAVRGKRINNREVLAQRVTELRELKSCHLVFVSGREAQRLSEVLSSLSGTSALLVGESEDFAGRGGGFQLFVEDNTVRFMANVDALQRAHLTVSSKLLALAKIVHDQGHTREN